MPTLPSANVIVDQNALGAAGGADLITVFSPCPVKADMTPRIFGSADAVFGDHGYSEGVEYVALHNTRSRKPVNFVALPIDTPGEVGRHDTSGNTGTATTQVTVGGDGSLTEHEGILRVVRGGTVGTDQILLGLSLDGGKSEQRVRLGTGTSYTIPFIGVSIAFTVGTLVEGETIHMWKGTGPTASAADLTTARENLAAVLRQFRSIILLGDSTPGVASAFKDELNAYETANERFVYGRCAARDRVAEAALSIVSRRMTGTPQLTFSTTASPDTITRNEGSWLADGFVVGDVITVAGSTSNDGEYVVAAVTALTLTVGEGDLTDEAGVAGVTVTGAPGIALDATGDTLTRASGSWLADGFAVGDTPTLAGTTADDGAKTITALTSTVMTLDTGEITTTETLAAGVITVTAGESKAAWMAAIESEYSGIDDEFRIDISAGKARVRSPFTGWNFRRPAAWAASVREYQHDLHVATWRKEDGPTGFDLYDTDGTLVEWDDRVDGEGASLARFTSFRTWSNGPAGAFIALSLTRAVDGSLLVLTNNVAVTNQACTTTLVNTEQAIGRSLVLNPDGTATADSLSQIESDVNAALELDLLTDLQLEGPRASRAVWAANKDDVLNVPEATLNGVLELLLNGVLHRINTKVRIQTAGA